MKFALRDWALRLAVLLLCAPLALSSDDLPDDDFTEEVEAHPVEWVPIITHFYLQPREAASDPMPLHFVTDKRDLTGLTNAWRALETLFRPRDKVYFGASYQDDEPVVCAWRAKKDGNGFEVHQAGAPPPEADAEPPREGSPVPPEERPIQMIRAEQPFDVRIGFTIEMNVDDPEKRDAILEKYFRVHSFELSIHEIDVDPTKIRGAPQEKAIPNGTTGLNQEVTWPEFAKKFDNFSWSRQIRTDGAYAIRAKLIVSGRIDNSIPFGRRKELAGEIRVSFARLALQDLDRLEWTTTRVTMDDWMRRYMEWVEKIRKRRQESQ